MVRKSRSCAFRPAPQRNVRDPANLSYDVGVAFSLALVPAGSTIAVTHRSPSPGQLMTLIDPKGRSAPLGATLFPSGTNFSLYAREAIGVDLLFFNLEDDPRPSRIVPFDPVANCTCHYWHAFVPGIATG